jgi:hypothetical protein
MAWPAAARSGADGLDLADRGGRMAGKTVAIVALVTALVVPCLVNPAGAAVIPTYFENDWVGALCVQMAVTGSTAKVPVLILLTFDKVDNGGITLAKADQLFNFLKTQISFFVGASVTQTCSLTPTQVNTQYHLNGLQAARSLTATYTQYGFLVLMILDSFWAVPPDYLKLGANALTLRSDLFLTNGSNDITYISSAETLQSFLP